MPYIVWPTTDIQTPSQNGCVPTDPAHVCLSVASTDAQFLYQNLSVRSVLSWVFLSCEFHVLFWEVTLLSFQVTCPSSCITGLTSPLIPDCVHLCSLPWCMYVCVFVFPCLVTRVFCRVMNLQLFSKPVEPVLWLHLSPHFARPDTVLASHQLFHLISSPPKLVLL